MLECPSGNGKVWYREEWKAKLALIRIAMETPPGVKHARSYYLCKACRCYHLTSQANGSFKSIPRFVLRGDEKE